MRSYRAVNSEPVVRADNAPSRSPGRQLGRGSPPTEVRADNGPNSLSQSLQPNEAKEAAHDHDEEHGATTRHRALTLSSPRQCRQGQHPGRRDLQHVAEDGRIGSSSSVRRTKRGRCHSQWSTRRFQFNLDYRCLIFCRIFILQIVLVFAALWTCFWPYSKGSEGLEAPS